MFKRILHNWQSIILVVLLVMTGYSIFHKQPINTKNISVYTQGQNGLSVYQVWLAAGNKGNLEDYLDSLQGKGGTDASTIFIPESSGQNGKDGSNASPCHVSQDTSGNTIISCPDGSSAFIAKAKDGTDGISPPENKIAFNTDPNTCMLQYKYTQDRFYTDIIKIPECSSNV